MTEVSAVRLTLMRVLYFLNFVMLGALADLVFVPWPYVLAAYMKTPGDPWGRRPAPEGGVR